MSQTAEARDDSQIVDEYRLVRPLGRDPRAARFLAHDRILDRPVVLLFIADAAEGALTGARALAGVMHPNVCRVHRVRDGVARRYVVSAFARGRRLDAPGANAGPLPDGEVLAMGRALAGALRTMHAAGVAHGDVRAGRVILSAEGEPQLFGFERARPGADEATRREDVVGLVHLLEAIAGPALRPRLAELVASRERAPTADALSATLEDLAHPAHVGLDHDPAHDESSPYRGLRPFEAEHGGVFFGRRLEIAELLTRLRGQPLLLVAGRSGAGKSSLVRAGIGPEVAAGGLGERSAWDVVTIAPGARPLEALAARLAPLFGKEAGPFADALARDPGLAGRLARGRADRGLLLLVDQLEEALTLAGVAPREAFGEVLGHFGELAPGVRVVMTLRSDFLARRGELGSLGRDLLRATYVLPPMRREGLRDAVEGPARTRGFAFETPAMVDALLDETAEQPEALALLSFALAELWLARDEARRVLPAEALRRLGSAAAALARHGDMVLATLRPEERSEARRLLLALVTAGETRARPTETELIGRGGEKARAALAALVRGRLVVVGETCELAHEALVRVWPRLRGWLDEASEARASRERLALAAGEWARLGRGKEGLGGERLLAQLARPGVLDGASDEARAFVEASRAALRDEQSGRWALVIGASLTLALVGAGAWAVSSARHRAAVARAVASASVLEAEAEDRARDADALRVRSLMSFEMDDVGSGEAMWRRMLAVEDDTDRRRREVEAALDGALALDPRHQGARDRYADVALARLLAAERRHQGARARELRAELDVYDDGSRAARLGAPAHVRVETDPPDATATLARYREDADGRLVLVDRAAIAKGGARELEPGSYRIDADAPGRYPTRYPFVVGRGEERALRVVLPRAIDVPEGMIYVPAGRTLYGSLDDEATRAFLMHQPAHEIEVGAFLIGRTEVTNGDYVAFLLALPEPERKGRLPVRLALAKDGRVVWTRRGVTLAPGEPYCKGPDGCVDWARVPVDGASREDGEHFAAWLARSGRVPGARLCTDREWERAARGADDRRYPNGNGEPGPHDACTLTSYGGDVRATGPCAAGTHSASQSPFGVEDMSGSESEWTAGPADVARPNEGAARGAGWFDFGMWVSIPNRGIVGTSLRSTSYGLRVCADVK